ncbi:recombinase family protein [Parablautia intestinalis]|uniref:recombinase family protein n=1 Tax=Parablautia intestinalis TaxID=2320100 RepID=UPI00256F2114|nr:recombinase family protein [Parablautia intestinalis]
MKVVAVYLRLSLEDERGMETRESNSISSQRILIRGFIRQDEELKEYEVKEFCDDGWSGTGMDRPGMNRLLAEVKKNRVQCIVVKDMSRFSRDYIEMGTYLGQIFPFMGVRFIALGDHYDSREHGGTTIGIDTAFQTLLYDLYSKDVSVKVKASFENKCANGEYVFGQVPFGYRKSTEERNTVIVDKKEAEVVRYIFSLAVQGKGSTGIAVQLRREGIPTITQMRRPDKKTEDGKTHAWSSQAVRNILNNRFYLGEMAYGKTVRKSVGSKNDIYIPKEEWKVIPDHHEALVTPEVFAQVSKFRPELSTKQKREKNPLTGKLHCGGCGYAMVYKPLQGKNKYRRFECHKHSLLKIPECCTYFNADILEELVLAMINKELMMRGEAAGQEKSLHMFQKARGMEIRKQLKNLHQERKQALESKEALYERYAAGGMTPEEYRREADGLDQQAGLLKRQIHDGEEEILKLEEECERLEADMKQVIRYSHMEKLTQELADTFVKKVYVYKGKRVEIEWNFRER